ncbi:MULTISPECIES: COG3400 family protein [unclassified Helicobacter]|uniref:COG3400 family protein n=1 Tax=unclassified Helicobacter TaxID=2593540 RepID=UPI000CF19D01|nr:MULTISPECIES: TrkA C-terminal domain-containing protein [unclassified Helicobacter]
MKKIVLILDGIVAKKFLQNVLEKYFSNNTYIVISKDGNMLPSEIPNGFYFYTFDPTSPYRLLNVIDSEVSDILIFMEDAKEKEVISEIVTKTYTGAHIVINVKNAEEAQQYKDNDRISIIDESILLSSALTSKLPNVPRTPQNFGFGLGEIMEITVPFGSVFAYRHIGSIQQKNYRIVGIYRQNDFLLSTYSLVIQPNDTMLIAGDPKVLTQVYHQVRSDIGQFPAPFGKDVYVYVDMILQSFDELMRDLNQAILLHRHLKNTKLYIIVLQPSDFDIVKKIKELDNPNVEVIFDYKNTSFLARFQEDLKKKIGIAVIGKEFFIQRKIRKALFNGGIPIFKTSYKDLNLLKDSIVVFNEGMSKGENISAVIFDVAIQMKLNIIAYDFDPDEHYQNEVLKDYESLSRIFDKKVTFVKTKTKNPILFLKEQDDPMLHFLPFEKCITGRRFFNSLSTKVEKISFMLDDHPQIFIPILEQVDE